MLVLKNRISYGFYCFLVFVFATLVVFVVMVFGLFSVVNFHKFEWNAIKQTKTSGFGNEMQKFYQLFSIMDLNKIIIFSNNLV